LKKICSSEAHVKKKNSEAGNVHTDIEKGGKKSICTIKKAH